MIPLNRAILCSIFLLNTERGRKKMRGRKILGESDGRKSTTLRLNKQALSTLKDNGINVNRLINEIIISLADSLDKKKKNG